MLLRRYDNLPTNRSAILLTCKISSFSCCVLCWILSRIFCFSTCKSSQISFNRWQTRKIGGSLSRHNRNWGLLHNGVL